MTRSHRHQKGRPTADGIRAVQLPDPPRVRPLRPPLRLGRAAGPVRMRVSPAGPLRPRRPSRPALDRAELGRRAPSLWRYHELLPVQAPGIVVTLGEGMTPLVPLPRLARRARRAPAWP